MIEIHPTNKNEVAWTSFMPALGYALGASFGPVLEIGVGHFSTPFLHAFCKASVRPLYSMEGNLDWGDSFRLKYKSNFHPFMVGPYDYATLASHNHFGVVFIDNSPGGEGRVAPFKALLGHSDYLVVHDYHRENEEAIKPFLEGVNYKIYNDYEPPTLLASLKHNL